MKKRIVWTVIAMAVSTTVGCGSFTSADGSKVVSETVISDVEKPEETRSEIQEAEPVQELSLGATTAKSDESATGFKTTFVYEDEKATNVQVTGSFWFYEKNDPNVYGYGFNLPKSYDVKNYFYDPNDWTKEKELYHIEDRGYTQDMVYNTQNQKWMTELTLPCGYYLYNFNVSYDDGKTFETVTLPGTEQPMNQFFVSYDAEKQNSDDDWTWLTPLENSEQRGTVITDIYPGADGREHLADIYLPNEYNEQRQEPYKVLYLSHGTGGDHTNWFYAGHLENIMDRLIAEEKIEPFVVVCMNNTVFAKEDGSGWDYDTIVTHTKKYLIPYIESKYHVSTDAEGKAYAGLSAGAHAATDLYYDSPELFSYFGMFSASDAGAWPKELDYEQMRKANLYLAAGFGDFCLMSDRYHTDQDTTIIGFGERLDEAEIAFNHGGKYVVVQGGHDFYTWPQIIRDYLETTLWK